MGFVFICLCFVSPLSSCYMSCIVGLMLVRIFSLASTIQGALVKVSLAGHERLSRDISLSVLFLPVMVSGGKHCLCVGTAASTLGSLSFLGSLWEDPLFCEDCIFLPFPLGMPFASTVLVWVAIDPKPDNGCFSLEKLLNWKDRKMLLKSSHVVIIVVIKVVLLRWKDRN